MHRTPATSAAEYLERTHDENKQRELHPADMGNIDLETFQAMSDDGRRAVWFAASADDRRGLAIQIIRRTNRGPDEESIALYLDLCGQRFGSDLAVPPLAEVADVARERARDALARGDNHESARLGRVADHLANGARLSWCAGRLLIASDSGATYATDGRGCECPNGQRSSSPSCWHLIAYALLEDMQTERATTADHAADRAIEEARALASRRRALGARLCALGRERRSCL